jgi:diguanylate cyclase (GGDEF)-like protein
MVGKTRSPDTLKPAQRRMQTDEDLGRLICYDPLTGLPNNILLHDRLEQLIAWSIRDKQQFSVLSVRLDQFEKMNGALGDAIGSRLLQIAANRLKICVREGDTVSHAEGGAFTVLLRNTDAKGAARVAKIILKSLDVGYDINEGVRSLQISAHTDIGISVFPQDAQDAGKLLRHALAARQHIKKAQTPDKT